MIQITRRIATTAAAFSLAACSPAVVPAPLHDLALETASGIPIVQFEIGDSEPLNFMIDSGFDINVLDPEVALGLGLKVGAAAAEDAPGGDIGVAQIDPADLRAGGETIPAVPFSAIDIAALGSFVGRPISGILGHDFLSRFVVDLDYAAGRMRLWDSATWRYTGEGAVLPMQIVDRELLVDCTLTLPSGRQLSAPFKLDTGSFDVAGLALNFVRGQQVIEPGMPEINVSGVGVGGTTSGRLFRARAFRIGNVTIEQPQLGYDVDSAGFENRTNAGTVGAGALARSRVILDYAHRQLILDQAYSGRQQEEFHFGLLLVSPPPGFDEVIAYQVMPNSAASQAGIRPFDVIVAIDGAHRSLLEARRALQTNGTVSVRYQRDDTETTVTMRPTPLVPALFN